jgi:glucosylceramidase
MLSLFTRLLPGLSLAVLVLVARAAGESPQMGHATSWLTRIDDGDARQAAFLAAPQSRRYDERQDDDFVLLRRGQLPIQKENPRLSNRVTLDPTRKQQTMLGLGAAMTDSSAWVLMNLKSRNPALFAFVMQRLFSPGQGAGFSVLRLPMGASDYTATPKLHTYCDEPSPGLEKFSIAHDQAYVIPALREALKLNPSIRIIATPWSPPAWMKTNGRLEGLNADDRKAGRTCRLKPEHVRTYAAYFVKFLEAYRDAGIDIWGVTPQNEPQFDSADYPCLRMDENDQLNFIRQLGPMLDSHKLKTRIFVHDHNWTLSDNERKASATDVRLDPLDSVTQMLSDPTAARYIAGSAWHCYAGGVDDMRRVYTTLRQRFPDKQILCTESTGWGRNRGAWFGDVEWGMRHNWLGGPQAGAESAIQWNLVMDHNYGPTLRHDSAATGMAAINTEHWDEARFEREFYAMAHLSIASPSGAVHMAAETAGPDTEKLEVIAFILPAGRTSLAAFNRNRQPRKFQIEHAGGYIPCEVPGRSILTVLW